MPTSPLSVSIPPIKSHVAKVGPFLLAVLNSEKSSSPFVIGGVTVGVRLARTVHAATVLLMVTTTNIRTAELVITWQ